MRDVAHRPDPPGDWQQALAALPLEAPPPGGWNRVASHLPARGLPSARRKRWPISLAAVATLMAVAIVPALWRRTSAPDPATPVAVAPASTQPSPPTASAPTAFSSSHSDTRAALPPPATGSDGNPSGTPAAAVAAATKAAPAPAHRPTRNAIPDNGGAVAASAPAAQLALESLYVESAHLESLLAQIQDERVVSGPAMAMTGALEDRIAAIDHALSQSGDDDIQQRELWQQRVDALRQLAGLEGTQRWLAANGNAGSDDGSPIY